MLLDECWGGPLDGRRAPARERGRKCFAWPRGWYYRTPGGVFRWQENGHYTEEDDRLWKILYRTPRVPGDR